MKYILILMLTVAFGQESLILEMPEWNEDRGITADPTYLFYTIKYDTTRDTTHILVVYPANIELDIPLHHWEEAFYGVNHGYSNFNIMMFKHIYCVETTIKSDYGFYPSTTLKHYDMNWKEVDISSGYLQFDYEVWKPDTIRN